jgi:hypothetical protein
LEQNLQIQPGDVAMVSSSVDNQLSSFERAPPFQHENAGQTFKISCLHPEELAYLSIPKQTCYHNVRINLISILVIKYRDFSLDQ